MSGSQPTHGYPSRTAAVVAWREQGVPTRVIAQRLGIENKTVSALMISAERKATRRATETNWNPPRSALILPEDVKRYLRKPALARGVSVYQLALTIVEIVARDGLADAILDDSQDVA